MKHIKNISYALLASAMLFSTSCEKALEVDPLGRIVKEDAFANETYVRAFLNSIYTVVGSGSWNSGRIQKFNELLGDQYYGAELGGTSSEIFNRNTGRFNGDVGSFFNEPYIAINRSNTVLENLDKITPSYKDNAEGQAKFVRAFAHFDLVKLFAQPYGFTTDNSHAGISLRTASEIKNASRATVKAVYDQIVADLKDAEVKLPAANGVYPTKWAAKAMLARVYFQMNNFAQAFIYANDVIVNGKNTAGANLSLDANFTSRFSKTGSSETIFEVVNENNNQAPRSDAYRGTFLSTGTPEMRLSKSFYNSATANPNDKRIAAWYVAGTDPKFSLLKKFDELGFKINVIHLTEMKLIRAESGAETGGANLPVAIQDVNDLRNRAYNNTITPLGATTSAALVKTIVRSERSLEMVGEGDRTQQLKRIGAKGEASTVRGVQWNCPGMLLQFPSAEVDNSPGMSYNPEGGC